MGRPLNNRSFGAVEGNLKITIKTEDGVKDGYVIKQLSTSQYRVGVEGDDKDYDVYLVDTQQQVDDLKEDEGYIKGKITKDGVTEDVLIKRIWSALATTSDNQLIKWTTSPFDTDNVVNIDGYSEGGDVEEGEIAGIGTIPPATPDGVPTLVLGTGNPAVGFVTGGDEYIQLGISVRYTRDADIPLADGTSFEMPAIKNGRKWRFAFSAATLKGALLADYDISLLLSLDTENPSLETDVLVFKYDPKTHYWNSTQTGTITDSAGGEKVVQNIQAYEFDFIRDLLVQTFEEGVVPFGKFKIALVAKRAGVEDAEEMRSEVDITILEGDGSGGSEPEVPVDPVDPEVPGETETDPETPVETDPETDPDGTEETDDDNLDNDLE